MSADTSLIKEILDGGFYGFLGQCIRLVLGTIKLQTSNKAKSLKGDTPEEFNIGQMFLSLFIGFLAGALSVALGIFSLPTTQDRSPLMPIMAAGYAGADFIEGIFKAALSKIIPPKTVALNNNNLVVDNHPLIVADEAQKK